MVQKVCNPDQEGFEDHKREKSTIFRCLELEAWYISQVFNMYPLSFIMYLVIDKSKRYISTLWSREPLNLKTAEYNYCKEE